MTICEKFDQLVEDRIILLPNFALVAKDAPELIESLNRFQEKVREKQLPDWHIFGTYSDFSNNPYYKSKLISNIGNNLVARVSRVTRPKIDKLRKRVCDLEDFFTKREVQGQKGLYRLF